ncbi:MAG: type III pantothenate kinase [Mariprofundaceae bacterium]
MKKFLTVDIGNTQMVFGIFMGEELLCHWRLSSNHHLTSDELAWQLHGMFEQFGHQPLDIDGIMAASVVPHLDMTLSEACERICKKPVAFVGSSDVKTGMAVDYKNPKEVGADRIANAIAAKAAFGAPVIVLDCGTATTFDVISAQGHYAGGLITPGMALSIEALSQRAAKLPEVSITRTDTLIGRDTITSMQAGTYWSSVDGLRGIIARLQQIDEYASAPVIATGGLSEQLLEDIPEITAHLPYLTLDGLRLLAESHFCK